MIRYRFPSRPHVATIFSSLSALALAGTGEALLIIQLGRSDINLWYFFLLLGTVAVSFFICALLYALWHLLTIRYTIDQDHLSISTGWQVYHLPLSGVSVKKFKKRPLTSFWKDKFSGRPDTLIYAAACFPFTGNTISLEYAHREFVINPADHVGFLSALYRVTKLRELEKDTGTENVSQLPWKKRERFLPPVLTEDRFMRYLWMLDILLLLVLSGYIMWGIGTLHSHTVLRYNLETGILLDSDRPSTLLLYAAIPWALFILTSLFALVVHSYEKLAAYITLGFFPFVEISIGVAVYGLLRVSG